MERTEIVSKLQKIIATVVKHENFEMKNELSAAEVDGWDSLTHMVIITEIEKNFQVKFKLKELNKLNNLGNLIELIQSKLG
ncbi:MAG TPA: acyl carrier protein [Bacteroidia bacterium]|jgi:acyl carrier protein|nr:acyl carrier protein [Bacteroidia bacterium]HRG51963.1 acyl carrier protein [Bacteroidia bacterium]